MQSFREYLKNSPIKYPVLVINFDNDPVELTEREEDDIVNSMNELGFPKTVHIDLNRNQIINLELSKSYSKNELFKLSKDYLKYLAEFSDSNIEPAFDDWYPTIVIRDTMPSNIQLGTTNCVLNFQDAKNVSLSGIDKNIVEFERIAIYNPENITSSVLGLLKLSYKNDKIYFNHVKPKTYEKFPWINIINEAIGQKTDLLDVQEELISKGFKQYAKL